MAVQVSCGDERRCQSIAVFPHGSAVAGWFSRRGLDFVGGCKSAAIGIDRFTPRLRESVGFGIRGLRGRRFLD